jgi:hypothetical protein
MAHKAIVAITLSGIAVAGCGTISAAISSSRGESIQKRLTCGMSVATVESIAGTHIVAFDTNRLPETHYAQDGMTQMAFRFEREQLRASQVHVVTGLTSIEREPWVEHCK